MFSLYPQLFTYECANIHSNKAYGYIQKINFYNRIVDKLQINQSQRPIETQRICDKIYKALANISDNKKLYTSLVNVRKFVKENIKNILENISNLSHDTIPIRAEFRLALNRVTSMVPLIDNHLSDEFLNDHCIVLNLEDVVDILKHWIILLYTPIMDCLSHFNGELRFNYSSNTLLKKYIPTISAFESLIEATLFGGNLYSFLDKTIWSDRASGVESLKLKQSIIKYNRLNFAGACWNRDLKLIQGSTELLEFFLAKYKIKTESYRESYQLLHQIGQDPCLKARAKLLWNSYFQHIWSKFPNDIKFPDNNIIDYSINKIKPSRKVFIQNDSISFSDAFNRIFDLSKLDNKTGPNSWNVPFLVCYKKVISEGAIKDDLDTEMLDFAIDNIEYIHEAGARYRFFKQTEHHFIKLCTCPRIQNASFSIATHQKVSKVSIPKQRFCQLELNMLCIGLNYFAGRNRIFKLVAQSNHLGFSKSYDSDSQRKKRDNTQLSKLRHKLQINNELKVDETTGMSYHINSSVEACTPLERVNYSDTEDDIYNFNSDNMSKKRLSVLKDNFAHRFEECTPQSSNFESSDKNSADYHETRNFSNLISEPCEKDSENTAEALIEKLNRKMLSVGITQVKQHLKVLLKLPHDDSNIFPATWSEIHNNSITTTGRDFKKWNELKDLLISEKLLQIKIIKKNSKKFTRYFRLFKISSDKN